MALVNDYEVVVKGLGRMFEAHADEVEIVEYDVKTTVASPVDIALVDTFAQPLTGPRIDDVLASPDVTRVMVCSLSVDPAAVEAGLGQGVSGYLSKALTAADLIAGLRRVHLGERVVVGAIAPAVAVDEPLADVVGDGRDWPGREDGLTAREAEIVALITAGLSNDDIARQTFLSINSVKSYIRTAYRRMGVTSRSQAVLWGVRHGLAPQPPTRERVGG